MKNGSRAGDVVSDAIRVSSSAKSEGKGTTDKLVRWAIFCHHYVYSLCLWRIGTSAEAALVQVFDSPWATAKTDDGLTVCIKPDFVIHGAYHLPDGY
jgi:hypothetical protein